MTTLPQARPARILVRIFIALSLCCAANSARSARCVFTRSPGEPASDCERLGNGDDDRRRQTRETTAITTGANLGTNLHSELPSQCQCVELLRGRWRRLRGEDGTNRATGATSANLAANLHVSLLLVELSWELLRRRWMHLHGADGDRATAAAGANLAANLHVNLLLFGVDKTTANARYFQQHAFAAENSDSCGSRRR